MQPELRIAVWGHYYGGNLGDELVVATIVDAIRRRLPNAQVVGISMAPADTRERHGIESYPINPDRPHFVLRSSTSHAARLLNALGARVGRIVSEVPFLVRSYRTLRGVDLVVVSGSGQLLDEWRGPWLHPYTTFRWAMLARVARVPMLYPSVGAGPIESRLSAFFIRTAVSSSDYVSVRDAHSGRVLASIGISRPIPVCPDIGYGIPDEWLRGARAATARRRPPTVVGLNVMAHQDPRLWPRGDVRRYETFLRKMAAFTRWLLDNDYTVRLFSSQTRADRRAADDLMRLLDGAPLDPVRFQSAIDEIDQAEDLVRVVADCDVIVASRYHSVLLPLLLDIPVLGLAYNAKTSELLRDAGFPERCLDIDAFSVQELVTVFHGLARDEKPEANEARRQKIAEHRAAVEEQFDKILPHPRSHGRDSHAAADRGRARRVSA